MPQSSRLLSQIARTAVIVALCFSLGAYWIALQSVAWATMVVEYSQRVPLAKAMAETFDGNHPCKLCKHISSAQQSEKKRDTQPIAAKLDLICGRRAVQFIPPFKDFSFASFEAEASTLDHSPAIPPPRGS